MAENRERGMGMAEDLARSAPGRASVLWREPERQSADEPERTAEASPDTAAQAAEKAKAREEILRLRRERRRQRQKKRLKQRIQRAVKKLFLTAAAVGIAVVMSGMFSGFPEDAAAADGAPGFSAVSRFVLSAMSDLFEIEKAEAEGIPENAMIAEAAHIPESAMIVEAAGVPEKAILAEDAVLAEEEVVFAEAGEAAEGGETAQTLEAAAAMDIRAENLARKRLALWEAPRDPEPTPVPLFITDQPSSPILPSDIYLPSPVTEETFTYQGDLLSICAGVEPRKVQPGDFAWDGDRLCYTGSEYDVIFGVDVSSYNNSDHSSGLLDWEAAKADGVDFAIIRVGFRGTTTGSLNKDACYAVNIEGAQAAGIRTGAYVFSQATSVEEALEEADLAIECLQGYTIDGPVCYDWENLERSYRVYRVGKEMATACAVAFCRRIAAAGYTPIVYESRDSAYQKFDQGALAPYMTWYTRYLAKGSSNPYPDLRYQMDMWQFSKRCAVAGIGGRIDGNLWFLPKG